MESISSRQTLSTVLEQEQLSYLCYVPTMSPSTVDTSSIIWVAKYLLRAHPRPSWALLASRGVKRDYVEESFLPIPPEKEQERITSFATRVLDALGF